MSKEYTLQLPALDRFEVKYYFSSAPRVYAARQYPTHMHDAIEIYVLLEGDASFVVESSLYHPAPGDVILTKPNEIHNCVLNTDSVHNHLCFWVDASVGEVFSEFLQHDFGRGNLISPTPEDKLRLSALYDRLHAVSEEGDQRRGFYLLFEILDILARTVGNVHAPQAIPAELARILEDIDAHLLAIDGLDYFTEKFFVSRSTLGRLFRTYLHITPGQYLEAKRLAYSRMLLKKGRSVLAACMESGFSNPSNYIRLFKKRFGITPGEYRNT